MKKQIYRHGEICFIKIDSLPTDLTESKTNVFSRGKTGNSHTFKGGKLYLKNEGQYIIGYFQAKKTKLYHNEHSPEGVPIPDGLYELRKQSEWVNGELRQIID
jgi:hypothetical protein